LDKSCLIELQLNEYELPVLKKLPGKKKETKELKRKGDRVILFDSDMDDNDELELKIDKGCVQKKKKT